MNANYVSILLTAAGAIIMVQNIVRYFTFSRQLSSLYTRKKTPFRVILLVYIVLLFFFLGGYIFVGLSMLLSSDTISYLLVGLIFFFGSIFVLIGLFLQIYMSRAIQQSNFEITQVLISSVEARDANLNGHSIHVARLVMLLYSYLPREKQRLIRADNLEYASLLHDIGKLGVSERVLNKAGPLDRDEWLEVARHPEIGGNILHGLERFEETAHWVRCHHERCDGKGYLGLSVAQIPYPSLIISVADTYSAITMRRSYRDAKDDAHACCILRECRGNQLDSDLVDLFLSIPRDRVEACMPHDEMLRAAARSLE